MNPVHVGDGPGPAAGAQAALKGLQLDGRGVGPDVGMTDAALAAKGLGAHVGQLLEHAEGEGAGAGERGAAPVLGRGGEEVAEDALGAEGCLLRAEGELLDLVHDLEAGSLGEDALLRGRGGVDGGVGEGVCDLVDDDAGVVEVDGEDDMDKLLVVLGDNLLLGLGLGLTSRPWGVVVHVAAVGDAHVVEILVGLPDVLGEGLGLLLLGGRTDQVGEGLHGVICELEKSLARVGAGHKQPAVSSKRAGVLWLEASNDTIAGAADRGGVGIVSQVEVKGLDVGDGEATSRVLPDLELKLTGQLGEEVEDSAAGVLIVLTISLAKLGVLAIEIVGSLLEAFLQGRLVRESHGEVEVVLGDVLGAKHVHEVRHDLVIVISVRYSCSQLKPGLTSCR